MADQYYDDEEEQPDDRVVTLKRTQIKELEENAKAGRKAAERLAALERENAFHRAGIPLEDKRGNYFIKGYEGELTPEAIKAEWEESFGQSSQETHGATQEEAAAHQRVAEVSTGAEPPKTSMTLEDLERAQSTEEVLRLVGEAGLLATRE